MKTDALSLKLCFRPAAGQLARNSDVRNLLENGHSQLSLRWAALGHEFARRLFGCAPVADRWSVLSEWLLVAQHQTFRLRCLRYSKACAPIRVREVYGTSKGQFLVVPLGVVLQKQTQVIV
jgi:hypothetical protein